MHYYEWNNLIGELLFSPTKGGQPVLLYLTKEQITQAAMDAAHFETEDDAWSSFTRSFNWFGRNKNLTDRILESLGRSHRICIGENSYETYYPVCLTLLVVSVLPITDASQSEVNQSNYYDRAATYAQQHCLPTIVKQNETVNWNSAWTKLERWSLVEKSGALGKFQVNYAFKHIYVGKPFSQCLIPPTALRDLPRAFVRAGWVPQQPLVSSDWHHLLQYHGYDLGFRQAALQTIGKDQSLGDYAISILQERFDRWDGTILTAAAPNIRDKLSRTAQRRLENIIKEDTAARFFLSFPDPEDSEGRFCWQYRVHSTLEAGYPDQLQLGDYAFSGQVNGWSNAVRMPFQEQLNFYDSDNKWRVKWPDADIRLFEQGQWRGLSSSLWIEVNELSRVNRMWAICKPASKQLLRQWGLTFGPNQFGEWLPDSNFDATDWPTDYGLFWFECPTQGIPSTRFSLSTKKQLEWTNGLKVQYNTFYNRHQPLLRVVNGDGSETVTAFTETGQQLDIQQFPDNPIIYQFIGDLPIEQVIICYLADENSSLSCQFKAADPVVQANDFPALPARNAFGEVTNLVVDTAYTGFVVSGLPDGRLNFMLPVFYPKNDQTKTLFQPLQTDWSLGDELLAYLTCCRESRPPQFFEEYETLLAEACSRGQLTMPTNVSKLRRWALGWYDTLGHIDYEYESGRIIVLPPTLIPVPCERGHRVILVGGRSPELIQRLRQLAEPLGVTVALEAQTDRSYLAPSVVSLYTTQSFYGKQHSPIEQIAQQLSIQFLADERPAWRLLERSGSATDYQATLIAEPEVETSTWTLRVFNPTRLCFERSDHSQVDKAFTLVERQLNAYQFAHYLWVNGQSYRVDKNWGRFLVLHHLGQQVIFKRNLYNQIAIPATLPLPRVLARGFALLSGKIPMREEHNFDGTKRSYLLYENAGSILSDNYIRKLGQHIQSTNF